MGGGRRAGVRGVQLASAESEESNALECVGGVLEKKADAAGANTPTRNGADVEANLFHWGTMCGVKLWRRLRQLAGLLRQLGCRVWKALPVESGEANLASPVQPVLLTELRGRAAAFCPHTDAAPLIRTPRFFRGGTSSELSVSERSRAHTRMLCV